MVYDTSVISAPLLGVAVYSTSIRLSSTVPVGNFVDTVILGLLYLLPFTTFLGVLFFFFAYFTIFLPFDFTFAGFDFTADEIFT